VVRHKAKGPVDPAFGARVRQLREARGMTQADLAGTDFTKGFISLLETGRTRASLRAAEIIAGRLGMAAAELMRVPETAQEAYLEVALVAVAKQLTEEKPADALQALEALEKGARGASRPRWLRLRGRALSALGRNREAVTVLDEAARGFRSLDERELMARTLFELAQVYGRLDEQAEALNLALQVETLFTENALVDRSLELHLLAFLGAVLVNLGDLSAADLRTERARAVAEDVTDLRVVADLYYNLAVTRQRQDDGEGALTYARRSLDAYERLHDGRAIASTWNTLGWIYGKRKQFARAAEALANAEKEADAAHYTAVLPWVEQNRAEVELARGNFAAALTHADASIAHPAAADRCKAISSLVRAEAVAHTKATNAEVIRAFDRAAQLLEPFGRRLQARAHHAKFEALVARGRLKESNEAAQRAFELMRPSLQ
jgi:tetratricopeptide (TPR) repeat protein